MKDKQTFELQYCEKCRQMTNHYDNRCQKCLQRGDVVMTEKEQNELFIREIQPYVDKKLKEQKEQIKELILEHVRTNGKLKDLLDGIDKL